MVLSWFLGMHFRCHHTGIYPCRFGLGAVTDISEWDVYYSPSEHPKVEQKLSYLKRENEQDTVVSDIFLSRSALCISHSVLSAAEHL